MRYETICDEGNRRLLLIFAGWGMDAGVFRHLRRPGYDIMVVWDYSSFYIDWSCVDRYSEICLLAWSMGVYAASQSVQAIESRITRRVAVNGTPCPIDDRYGIPTDIFYGTLDNLSEASLARFNRRMCATRADLDRFNAVRPTRGIESLRAELQAIADRHILNAPTHFCWDAAVAACDDRIFPLRNQRQAWQAAGVPLSIVDGGHYIDFADIIDHNFIDKTLVGKRFEAGTATYDSQAAVQYDAVERLTAAIKGLGLEESIKSARNAVLEIGSGSGALTRYIASRLCDARFVMWDLAAPMPAGLPAGRRYEFVNCDAELELRRVPRSAFDHIFSASTIQWFNSPERFLADCHRALREGGCALLTTYTEGNLHEITDITGNALPLLTPGQWERMAATGFDILYSCSYTRDIDFETPAEVLRHLKLTGVNSLSRSSRGTVSARHIIEHYPMRLDGRYHLTYHPYILILRKR